MKVTLESTDKIVLLDGVPARVWEGTSETGVPVHAFITRISASLKADLSQFEAELEVHRTPSDDVVAYPMRLLL